MSKTAPENSFFFSFTKFSLTEFPRLRLVLLLILARRTELWEYLTLRVHIISFYAGFLSQKGDGRDRLRQRGVTARSPRVPIQHKGVFKYIYTTIRLHCSFF